MLLAAHDQTSLRQIGYLSISLEGTSKPLGPVLHNKFVCKLQIEFKRPAAKTYDLNTISSVF